MARDSGSHYTVTLTANGREVKRSAGGSDGWTSRSESGKVPGSKRSVKSRLETRGNDPYGDGNHDKRKRHKEESNQARWNKNGDLRYTILQKNKSKESQEMDQPTITDLRDKLSRKTNTSPADSRSHPPETTHGTRKNMLLPRDGYNDKRESMVEDGMYRSEKKSSRGLRDVYRHERQREPEFREPYADERQSRIEFRDAYADERQSQLEFRDAYADERQSMIPDQGNSYDHVRQGMMDPKDSCDWGKHRGLETGLTYDCGRQDRLCLAPPSRAGSNPTGVDLGRNPPLTWDLGLQRQRSPERILCTSVPTPYYPERNEDNFQKAAMISPYGEVNSNLYGRNNIPSPPRPAGPEAFPMPPLHPFSSLPLTRPVPSVAQYPQTSGLSHKHPFMVEQPTVVDFLRSLNLERFCIPFMAEEVDFNALKQMTDADLKELNIPIDDNVAKEFRLWETRNHLHYADSRYAINFKSLPFLAVQFGCGCIL